MADSAATIQRMLRDGIAQHQQGRFAEAERLYTLILQQQPSHFDALHLLGLLALDTNRAERGVELIRKAISIDPGFAPAHDNLGNGLRELNRLEEALASYDRAIALKPDYADAYYNRGVALQDLRRPAEALASYDRAIALKPDLAEAYSARGSALTDLERPEEALANYDRAIALRPGFAEAYNNRGNTLQDLNRLEEALASFDRAIALKPGFAEAYCNRGNALRDLKRAEAAVASFDKAIALKPGFAEAYHNRGNTLQELKRLPEALASYDKAIALKPDLPEAEGERLHTKMRLCDWNNIDAERARLIASVRNGNALAAPFAFLALPSSAEDQLRCARQWAARKYPPSKTPIWQGERYDHDRLRVAFLSADYRAHAVAYLAAGLIEELDRSRFAIVGVSYGSDDRSDMRHRLEAGFDDFHDVRRKSDKEVARLLRGFEVDIAIDLTGYTEDSRPGIFAYRAAPIQAAYLGYPGTTGAPLIDYIIADKIVCPIEQQRFYTEKIVHLPDCYQANDRKRKIAAETPRRQAAGLPQRGFVFCCFNINWKITPEIFGIWMRLLKQVEGSVLWLLEDNRTAAENLTKEAAARGVAAERLIFAPRLPLPEHLARHRCADLLLDTLPYNAHTTASDALWAGLPVLTCRGETFAGRVAASLLKAIDLPELITTSLAEYEHLAIELAANPEKLAAIRQNLADHRLTTSLFDTRGLARHIEAAFTAMHERHKAGLAPDHIVIPKA